MRRRRAFQHRALLLAIVAACTVLAAAWTVRCRAAEVLAAHRELLAALEAHDVDGAYRRMSAGYRASHTVHDFLDDSAAREDRSDAEWHVSVGLWGDAEVYQTNGEGWTVGLVYVYTKDDDGWRFTGRGEHFVD